MNRLCIGLVIISAWLRMSNFSAADAPDWKEVKEIHLPAAGRSTQLAELARQLQVKAFIDYGAGWMDGEEVGHFDASNPTFESFSFPAGTIAEALNAYCAARPFQWHYWPEANAIWIEPKKNEMRLASLFLKSRFKEWNLESVQGATRPDSIVSVDDVKNAWSSSRKGECWILTGHYGIFNSRQLSFSLIRENSAGSKSPRDMVEYIEWWLAQHSQVIVGIQSRVPGERNATPVLLMGSFPEDLGFIPCKELVARINSDEKFSRFIPKSLCANELFRRSKYQMDQIVREYIGRNLFDVEAFDTFWDPPTKSKLVFEVFKAAPREAQLSMLKGRVIPEPDDYGPGVVAPWTELSKSDVDEFRKKAGEVLRAFEKIRKEPAQP
jgi:hypothetical protein